MFYGSQRINYNMNVSSKIRDFFHRGYTKIR
jgi:hypothetical protein